MALSNDIFVHKIQEGQSRHSALEDIMATGALTEMQFCNLSSIDFVCRVIMDG